MATVGLYEGLFQATSYCFCTFNLRRCLWVIIVIQGNRLSCQYSGVLLLDFAILLCDTMIGLSSSHCANNMLCPSTASLISCLPFYFSSSFQPCLQYWPEPGLQQFGPMTVELLSRTADDDVIIRLFRVQNITRVSSSPCQSWLVQVFFYLFFIQLSIGKKTHKENNECPLLLSNSLFPLMSLFSLFFSTLFMSDLLRKES